MIIQGRAWLSPIPYPNTQTLFPPDPAPGQILGMSSGENSGHRPASLPTFHGLLSMGEERRLEVHPPFLWTPEMKMGREGVQVRGGRPQDLLLGILGPLPLGDPVRCRVGLQALGRH